jgi:PAS domain S-box-containing protein
MATENRSPPHAWLPWAVVAAADLIVVALAALVTLQGVEAHRTLARENADNVARLLEAGLTASLDQLDLTLRAVADEHRRVSAAGRVDAAALEAVLARHRERLPDLVSIRITGPDGLTRYNAPHLDAAPVALGDREYFTTLRASREDRLVVARPQLGRIIRTPVLLGARRLSTPDGAFAGVVFGTVALSTLSDRLAATEVGPHGTVQIRWQDLSLVAAGGARSARTEFGDPRVPPRLGELFAAGRDGVVPAPERSPVDGVERISTLRRLSRYPLLVVVGLAPEDYRTGWRRQVAAVWLLVVAFAGLSVTAAWYGTASWRRRLADARLLAERAEHLRESEERFRVSFQTSRDSITISRLKDGTYLDVNEGFVRLFGYSREEVLGKSSLSMGLWADPSARARLVEGIRREGFVDNLETGFFAKGGRRGEALVSGRRIELRGEPLLLLWVRDVTAWKAAEAERDRLQLEVQQAQRLEGIGRLAGGVAHDFNNLLTVILSCVEMLRDALADQTPEVREDVEQISAAAVRARDLTRQLLAFARKQVIAPVSLDLGAVVRDGERLLRRILGEDVVLTVETEDGLWPVLCDPGQLEQLILNLAVNARDAMPSGGTLSITARNAAVELLVDRETGQRRLGPWVRLSVRDSGTGMTPEVQAHLFEPFFTTKPSGEGTGLGLAMVHGIVAQNGGHIEVESAPGQGTTFDVFLPRAAAAAAVPAPAPTPAAPAPAGETTILVVEDDPLVRSVSVRALRGAGYQVLVAASGAEATALAAHAGRIDLVLSDVVMPGMSGPEVVSELRRTRPGLRALFVSGYPQDAVAQRGVLEVGTELLAKPFTSAALLERVRMLAVPRDAVG